MKNTTAAGFILLFVCLFLTACAGPSDEKIISAQSQYAELTELHNQTVDAHKNIEDSSQDKTLTALSKKMEKIKEFNLQEMTEEQIDTLIIQIEETFLSYQECLSLLESIKSQEDAAVLVPISVTVINGTELTFSTLNLYQQDSVESGINILADLNLLNPGQTITGLVIQRDVSGTDWILSLEDTNRISYDIPLPVKDYKEEGVCLTLTMDGESLHAAISKF